MPFPGLTRLAPTQILTDTIWNELMDLLEAKFSGAVGANDLTYPLILGGDIDFGQQYGILGLRNFWNIINAAEYPTLNAAVAAAPAGGAVFIQPGYSRLEGPVTISAGNVTIVGTGADSVVQIAAASTGPLFDIASTGLSGITFSNLTLSGTGGGAGCIGIRAQRTTRLRIQNVYMTGFTGDFITLTNDGGAGNGCTDTVITNVQCEGGSDSHLFADDVSGLYISNFISKTASGDAIAIVPASSTHLAQDIMLSNVHVSGGGAKGIRIIGTGGAAIDPHSRIMLANCRVHSMTGLPIELGNTGTILKTVMVRGCSATNSTTDGLRIAASGGLVASCDFSTANTDGIDMANSIDLFVNGNNCENAGAGAATGYGVNAASTTTCRVIGNNCSDAFTDGVNRTSSTGLRALENIGDDAPTIGNAFFDNTTYTLTGTNTGSFGMSYTIPAGSLKTGDVIEVIGYFESASGATGVVEARFNAVGMTSQAIGDGAAAKHSIYQTIIRAANGAASSHLYKFDQTATTYGTTIQTIADVGGPTIDWTIDQALTFNLTAHAGSGNIDLRRVIVRMYGSK